MKQEALPILGEVVHNWHSQDIKSINGTIAHGYGRTVTGPFSRVCNNLWSRDIHVYYIGGPRGRYFLRTNSGKMSHEQNRLCIQTNLAKEIDATWPALAFWIWVLDQLEPLWNKMGYSILSKNQTSVRKAHLWEPQLWTRIIPHTVKWVPGITSSSIRFAHPTFLCVYTGWRTIGMKIR